MTCIAGEALNRFGPGRPRRSALPGSHRDGVLRIGEFRAADMGAALQRLEEGALVEPCRLRYPEPFRNRLLVGDAHCRRGGPQGDGEIGFDDPGNAGGLHGFERQRPLLVGARLDPLQPCLHLLDARLEARQICPVQQRRAHQFADRRVEIGRALERIEQRLLIKVRLRLEQPPAQFGVEGESVVDMSYGTDLLTLFSDYYCYNLLLLVAQSRENKFVER